MAKQSGSKKTVTAGNVESLGAQRLAAILLELADRQPNLKRRLRMELAAKVGPGDLALEIDKRLDMLAASKGRISWRRRPEFVADLDVQRVLIAQRLAALDTDAALRRMFAFLALAGPLHQRATDPKGEMDAVFLSAAEDLGALLGASSLLPTVVGETLANAILADSRGRWGDWLAAALPGLPPAVAAQTLGLVEAREPRPTPAIQRIVRMLADAANDPDAFIRAIPASLRKTPAAGAEIAHRLLAAGRGEEALAALQASDPHAGRLFGFGRTTVSDADETWDSVHIDVLQATGHAAEAQAARWAAFEAGLSADRLRDFVKRLPDFDDVEAVDRAVAHAANHNDFMRALRFLMEWPDLGEAAKLVVARRGEIDSASPDLRAWAERLESRQPLAAVLLLRAAATHAVRNHEPVEALLDDITALSAGVSDFHGALSPMDFLSELSRRRR